MSKYSRLPKPPEQEPVIKEPPKMPISPLCCLPILTDGNPNYKKQLHAFLSFEELLPTFQRLQVYQMLYMDELLSQLKEYRPRVDDKSQKTPMEVLTNMDKTGTMNILSKIMKFQKTGDMSALLEIIAPENPMLSMLLPMLSGTGDINNMMSAFMPMMGDLSSMFKI